MLIIVNERANAGNGARRWRKVEAALRNSGAAFDVASTDSEADAERVVAAAATQGHEVVVAAGGDGTVNGVLNAILTNGTDVALGAIGLGSSNDFHKPFAPDKCVDGVPVRLDPTQAVRADVGRATLTEPSGATRIRYFVLNASVGVVAQGNAFFNTPDKTAASLEEDERRAGHRVRGTRLDQQRSSRSSCTCRWTIGRSARCSSPRWAS